MLRTEPAFSSFHIPFSLLLSSTAKVRDEGGSSDELKKLLEAQEKSKKCTPLLIAAERGHLKCVHLLLQNGANVEAVDSDGWSASHRASYGGHSKVVKLLIERGANINRAAATDNWRPIHAAARSLQVCRASMCVL
jgi:ankyrin repeat protein